MSRSKQTPEIAIEVGGEPYVWRLHRRPQWSGRPTDWRGMAIAVRHAEGQREVLLEFPPGPPPRFGAPLLQAANIPRALIVRALTSALETGWEPLSRGKPVTIVVDAEGR